MTWKFRLRRSKKVGPLVVTQTQNGTSMSLGVPGLRYTWKADGKTQITIGIPGTGISWVKQIRKK